MITDRMTYRWLWSCLIAGSLLTGCADHSGDEPLPQPEPVYPLELRSVTRTVGATQIGGADCPDIKVLLTSATEKMQIGAFKYNSVGSGWTSTLSVKEERLYYMYGYMPEEITGRITTDTIAFTKPDELDYSGGIDITMNGLPSITDKDICVITGVQRVDAVSTATPDVKEGSFSYLSGIWGKNYVNLLMGHVYCGLELSFKLGDEYAKVRSIHLKDVTLTSTYGYVNAKVQLRKGNGVNIPTFTKNSDGSHSATLFHAATETDQEVLDKNHVSSALLLDKLVYCAPTIFDVNGTNLSITTEYDVYDKSGNKIGERSATNKLKVTASTLNPGQKKTIILTVQPTYLYVLSDGDLDYPQIAVSD